MIDIALTLAYIGTIAISGFLGYLIGKSVKKPNCSKPVKDVKFIEFDDIMLRAAKSDFIEDTLFIDCYYKGADECKKFAAPSVWISPEKVITSDGYISC